MLKKTKFGYRVLRKPENISGQKLEKSHNAKNCKGEGFSAF